MLHLSNIYRNILKKHISRKYKDVFQKNKYTSMHYYVERTSLSAIILLSKSTQESDIITNYLTQDTIKDFNAIDFVNWCNNHSIDFHVIHPSLSTLIKQAIRHPSFIVYYLNALKHMKASNHYITI